MSGSADGIVGRTQFPFPDPPFFIIKAIIY